MYIFIYICVYIYIYHRTILETSLNVSITNNPNNPNNPDETHQKESRVGSENLEQNNNNLTNNPASPSSPRNPGNPGNGIGKEGESLTAEGGEGSLKTEGEGEREEMMMVYDSPDAELAYRRLAEYMTTKGQSCEYNPNSPHNPRIYIYIYIYICVCIMCKWP